jgi:hypothetical protein
MQIITKSFTIKSIKARRIETKYLWKALSLYITVILMCNMAV